jgi:alpha-galactosidase
MLFVVAIAVKRHGRICAKHSGYRKMRRSWLVALVVSVALSMLGCSVLPAQRVDYDRDAGRWTLGSGPVIYRIAERDSALVLDYFGPGSRATEWEKTVSSAPRYDLAGVVDGNPMAPALHLVSQRTRTVAPGVAELLLTLRHSELPLEVRARYVAWGETGVFTREITLVNRGRTPIRVQSSPSVAWELPKGNYTLRYLYGSWGQERQLATEPVRAGARSFEQTRGRSTNGYVPWLSLRNDDRGVEYIAELAWSGNWWSRVERQPGTGSSPPRDQDVLLAMGVRPDLGGPLLLQPGDSITLPCVALTASAGDLDDAANQMHRYQREYVVPRSRANRPLLVQFNSWYAFGPDVNIENTMRSADIAASLGVEAYILDSGWYTSGDWSRTLGDYQADRSKFPKGLEELARHVHAKGMKFGLWVEIENVGIDSRVFQEHPDWCLSYGGKPVITADRCQLDFARPEVRRWASATIDRLVSAYDLDWIKIDYNIDIGDHFDPAPGDRAGRRLADHVESYYAWLDSVRAAHPDLIIENCSSGGLRFDMGVMAHAHTSWLSDFVDPKASLELGYGCTLQFVPEICNHWMVGDTDKGEVELASAPGWWDFMFRVPFTGQFGVSSRVWEWNTALRNRAAANIALYKRIRGTIAGADVYHLTPPPDRYAPTGWTALQYVTRGGRRSVLLAYRLARGAPSRHFRLRGLLPNTVYRVVQDGTPIRRATGAELASTGLPITLDAEWRSSVVEIAAER